MVKSLSRLGITRDNEKGTRLARGKERNARSRDSNAIQTEVKRLANL